METVLVISGVVGVFAGILVLLILHHVRQRPQRRNATAGERERFREARRARNRASSPPPPIPPPMAPPRPLIIPGVTTTVTRTTTINGRQVPVEVAEQLEQARAELDREVAELNRAINSTFQPQVDSLRDFGLSFQQATQNFARLSTRVARSNTVPQPQEEAPKPPDTRKSLHAQLMEDDD